MYSNSKCTKLFLLYFFLILSNIKYSFSIDMNADELYKSCSDYYKWVDKDYSIPVNDKILFNMGKCQGVIETLGKTMLTLCYERKRNVNINKNLTANLEGIKTIEIIEKFLRFAYTDSKLRSYSSSSYLISFISKSWPCK